MSPGKVNYYEREKPESLSDISMVLKNYSAKDSKFQRKFRIYSIFNHWAEIVGQEISKKTEPDKIFKDTLYISVSSPVWANELAMMSAQLISKINDFIGEEAIRSLRFKVK